MSEGKLTIPDFIREAWWNQKNTVGMELGLHFFYRWFIWRRCQYFM